MLLEGKGESFLIFLLSWKGDIVLCVSNKWHNSKVHDTHSKSIIEWLILFSFLPALLSPSLPLSSHDKDAKGKKKKFWNYFFELCGSLSNKVQSAFILSLSQRCRKALSHNEAEKLGNRYETPQLTCLDINLMHLHLCLVCQLLHCGGPLIIKSSKVYY